MLSDLTDAYFADVSLSIENSQKVLEGEERERAEEGMMEVVVKAKAMNAQGEVQLEAQEWLV